MAVVIAVSVTFIGLALAKPWDAGGARGAKNSPSISSDRPAGSGTAVPSAAAPTSTPFAPPPASADLLAASTPRAAWGVRAVVLPRRGQPAAAGSALGLAERWLAIDVGAGAAWDSGVTGTAVRDGDEVLALGVTTPPDAMPLDIRFWRIESAGDVRRIVPRPVTGPEAGSWLFLPDPAEETALGTWTAGTYRIDVLLGSRVVRLLTIVPAGVPAVPRVARQTGGPPDLVDQLRPFAPGPFALTPNRPVAIAVRPHEAVDERSAWLGPATGHLEIAAIGTVVADPVVGIGLLLPGEELLTAHLDRIAPVAQGPDVGTFLLPPVPTADGRRASGAILEYADLRLLETGFYHLTTDSTFPSGKRVSRSWNLDIVPSTPPVPPGDPLGRMARWVPLMKNAGHLAGEPLVTKHDLGVARGDGTCGGSAHISPSDVLFGIVEPAGSAVARIRLFALQGRVAPDIAVRIAPNAVDGLTLVALPAGGLSPGQWRLIVDNTSATGPDRLLYTVCVT